MSNSDTIVAVFVDDVPAFYSVDEEKAKKMAVKLFERMVKKMSDGSTKFYIEFLNNILTMTRVDKFSPVCYDNIVHTAKFYRINAIPDLTSPVGGSDVNSGYEKDEEESEESSEESETSEDVEEEEDDDDEEDGEYDENCEEEDDQ